MARIGTPHFPRPPHPTQQTQEEQKQISSPDSQLADYLTPEQRQALASGNVEAQQMADDAALAMGIQASLDEMDKVKNTEKSATRIVPEQELQARREINNKLRHWFTDRHMTIVANQGKNQNCLLISLIQHATGQYDSQHEKAASDFKDILTKESQGQIGKYDALYDDTDLMTALIKRLNENYNCDMRVDFYTADLNGDPAIRSVGDGKKPVIIFNQVGHFEAVVSGRQL